MSQQKRAKKIQKLIEPLIEQFKEIAKNKPKLLLNFLSGIRLPNHLSRRFRRLLKKQMKWLLGRFFFVGRQQPYLSPAGGFILPTIAILLLLFALVAGSILFRSANRSTEVVIEREQQVVTNAATPAIERAKAKLEYLIDENLPPLLPGSRLESILKNDLYTLPGESRLDLNNDGKLDNAWSFQIDTDGDTQEETVAYSIMIDSEKTIPSENGEQITIDRASLDQDKAENLIIRNGPLSLREVNNPDCDLAANSISGWDPGIGSSKFVRAFQITGVAIKNNGNDPTYAALELQQDREADLGNKWGAWFLNDLEIFPGPNFRWNGAMHTEGNLIIGDSSQKFHAYLISSPESCVYSKSNSEITLAQYSTEPKDNLSQNGDLAFTGQMITGSMKLNSFTGSSKFDIYGQIPPVESDWINNTKDGVESGLSVAERALDPVLLFTEGNKQSRGSDPSNTSNIDSNWENSVLVQGERIRNQAEKPPFVDDTYRADDRFGPKPKYQNTIDLKDPDGSSNKIGTLITSNNTNYSDELTNNGDDVDNIGLDGYWERRARKEGLRIIVGQRLELGNKFGWEGDNDPLYPPDTNLTEACPQSRSAIRDRCHELRQWKTLRDNLAAVQATAVYHYEKEQDFPVACIATVAHPGTNRTISNSKTFSNYTGTTDKIDTNFLEGLGTNGWEFAPTPPGYNKDTFPTEIGSNKPLGKALRNLAHFAGDPDGAFPPVQENTGTVVHPYPNLTMWGDFSNLRRALDSLDSSSYDSLSIADKTTIQTASCTLGMLAYNLNNIQKNSNINIPNNDNLLTQASDALQSAVGSNGPLPTNRQQYVSAIGEDLVHWIEQIQQVARDRQFGFATTTSTSYTYTVEKDYGTNGFKYGGTTYNQGTIITLNFNPETSNFLGLGNLGSKSKEKKFIRLALMRDTLDITKPKYPALYYIFPKENHAHNGSSASNEPYIDDSYIQSSSVNGSYTYKAITDNQIRDRIAVQPRSVSTWELPNSTTDTEIGNTITDDTGASSQNRYVALLDKGMFNGREMMSVRTLDIDLNMIRQNSPSGAIENWLPDSGIVYAFREDAVREDGIARPANGSWNYCKTLTKLTTDPTCLMDAVGTSGSQQDPPVDEDNGISPKPIDFYPDPDRRPYGFRLRNGQDIRRCHNLSVIRGMAFISDNPTYIFGDGSEQGFNLHVTASGDCNNNNSYSDRIEEFTTELNNNFSNFYNRNTLNSNFAREGDVWRPVEILSDAVTIVANNFVDGNIAQGIRDTDTGDRSSYRTLNAPNTEEPSDGWLTEDGQNTNNASNLINSEAPIKISRNGYPIYKNGSSDREYGKDDSNTYKSFSDGKSRISGVGGTRINAVIVSGLVPSRAQQSYGGLHNFPRFIHSWGGDLFISGSFLQLNFSTYATAPFDQDSWEPGNTTSSSERINYYGAPGRKWGYDVGLQYAPAGPISERFVTPSNARSEYYRELPVDDPYVNNLRCATDGNNQQIDPEASCQ